MPEGFLSNALDNLIAFDEVIDRAKGRGVTFGKGNPFNRLRYYTKIGLLPHAKRKSFAGGSPVGAYPESVVETLVEIDNELRSGKSVQQILREKNNPPAVGENAQAPTGKEGISKSPLEYLPQGVNITPLPVIKPAPTQPKVQIPDFSKGPPYEPFTVAEPAAIKVLKKVKPAHYLLLALLAATTALPALYFNNTGFRNASKDILVLLRTLNPTQVQEQAQILELPSEVGQVLGTITDPFLTVNAPTDINGLLTARSGIVTEGANVDAAAGEVYASNLIYSIAPGANVAVSGDQDLTISVPGVVTGSVVRSVLGTGGEIDVSAGENPTVGISSTYSGQTSINTLGGVSTGVWQATAIAATRGGTGITSYSTGDILYAAGAGTLARLPIGAAGETLVVSGGLPSWGAAFGIFTVQVNDVDLTTEAGILDFVGGDFSLTVDAGPPDEVNFQLASLLTTPIGVDNATNSWEVRGSGAASGGILRTTNDDGSTIYFQVTATGEIQIPSTETLQIGTVELNDWGDGVLGPATSDATAGAFLVGVYTGGFVNCTTDFTVQQSIRCLQSAIGAGGSKWTQGAGFIYLTTLTDDVVIGGSTIATGSFHFDESSGELNLGTNESLNGLLRLYTSGVGITDPTITTNAAGGLLLGAPADSTLDLNAAATRTFTVTNSDAGNVANLSVEGSGTFGTGLTVSSGGINNNSGGVTNAGAVSGVTTINMSGQLTSTLATGTAPFVVASTTLVSNLNADLLDSLTSADFLRSNASDTFEAGNTLAIAGDLSIADTNIPFTGGSTTFDLQGGATTTLSVINSTGGQVANLLVEGGLVTGATSEALRIGVTNDTFEVVRGGVTYEVCDFSGNCPGSGVGGDITDVGDVSSGAAFNGTQGNILTFEGTGANDALEIVLTAVNPSIDRTFTLPDVASGDICISNIACIATTGDSATSFFSSGVLEVGIGGTGATSFTANGVLYGNGSGAIGATTAGTNGQLLLGQTGSPPSFETMSGDATISNTGVLTISANAVALTTDTTGNYVASISNGSGITGGDGGGEGSNLTLALGPLTADWNQTGGFDILLNNASSELRTREDGGGTDYGTFNVLALTTNTIYNFPDPGGASDTVCLLTLNNCAGTGDISAVGNVSNGPAFTGADTGGGQFGNSLIFEGNTAVNDANDVTLTAADVAASRTFTLPDLGTDGTFAFLEGTQNFTGAKTFSDLTISDTSVPLTGASFTFDFNNAANRTFTITNSAAGVANLDVEGSIRLGAAGANNLLNTSAAGGAPTGDLFWGDRTLADSTNIGSYAVTAVTAGAGLSGGGGPGAVTVDVSAGNGISTSGDVVAVDLLGVTDSVGASFSFSGLEFGGAGSDKLTLLQGCSEGHVLKWDNDTDGRWECQADATGTSGIIEVQDDSNTELTGISRIVFGAVTDDFDVNLNGTFAEVDIDYATSRITRENQTQTISGAWTFSTSPTINDNDGLHNDVNIILGDGDEQGSIIFNDQAGTAFTQTLRSAATLTTGSAILTLPDTAGSDDTVCLQTLGNCFGAGGGVTTPDAAVSGRVAFFTGASEINDDANFFWDNTSKELGIGTTSPDATLEVLDTSGPQLRLTETDSVDFADFTVDGSGNLTIGLSSSGSQFIFNGGGSTTELRILESTGTPTEYGIIKTAALGSNRTYTFPNESGDVCLTSGNCAGVGGVGTITAVGNVLSGSAFTGSDSSSNKGNSLIFEGNSSTDDANDVTLTAADVGASRTFTLPDVASGDICISNIACIATTGDS
ncbi:MAG: hypothetical protein WD187_00005, partial [Candidatus Woykebacteria bacterium]